MNCENSGKYGEIAERRHSIFGGVVVKKAHRKVISINDLSENYC